jgi:hypothetical protein
LNGWHGVCSIAYRKKKTVYNIFLIGGSIMSKFYTIGGVSLIGGLVVLLFQTITSLMAPGAVVWKSVTLVSILDPLYLNWIETISWSDMKQFMEYFLSLPVYLLLIGSSGLSFILGGIAK